MEIDNEFTNHPILNEFSSHSNSKLNNEFFIFEKNIQNFEGKSDEIDFFFRNFQNNFSNLERAGQNFIINYFKNLFIKEKKSLIKIHLSNFKFNIFNFFNFFLNIDENYSIEFKLNFSEIFSNFFYFYLHFSIENQKEIIEIFNEFYLIICKKLNNEISDNFSFNILLILNSFVKYLTNFSNVLTILNFISNNNKNKNNIKLITEILIEILNKINFNSYEINDNNILFELIFFCINNKCEKIFILIDNINNNNFFKNNLNENFINFQKEILIILLNFNEKILNENDKNKIIYFNFIKNCLNFNEYSNIFEINYFNFFTKIIFPLITNINNNNNNDDYILKYESINNFNNNKNSIENSIFEILYLILIKYDKFLDKIYEECINNFSNNFCNDTIKHILCLILNKLFRIKYFDKIKEIQINKIQNFNNNFENFNFFDLMLIFIILEKINKIEDLNIFFNFIFNYLFNNKKFQKSIEFFTIKIYNNNFNKNDLIFNQNYCEFIIKNFSDFPKNFNSESLKKIFNNNNNEKIFIDNLLNKNNINKIIDYYENYKNTKNEEFLNIFLFNNLILKKSKNFIGIENERKITFFLCDILLKIPNDKIIINLNEISNMIFDYFNKLIQFRIFPQKYQIIFILELIQKLIINNFNFNENFLNNLFDFIINEINILNTMIKYSNLKILFNLEIFCDFLNLIIISFNFSQNHLKLISENLFSLNSIEKFQCIFSTLFIINIKFNLENKIQIFIVENLNFNQINKISIKIIKIILFNLLNFLKMNKNNLKFDFIQKIIIKFINLLQFFSQKNLNEKIKINNEEFYLNNNNNENDPNLLNIQNFNLISSNLYENFFDKYYSKFILENKNESSTKLFLNIITNFNPFNFFNNLILNEYSNEIKEIPAEILNVYSKLKNNNEQRKIYKIKKIN